MYGCLISGLIGDAMGGPTDGIHYKEIEEKFGRIAWLVDYGGRPVGSATDDSGLKHMLCKAIIRKGGKPDCEDWAEVWKEDMDLRMFMGLVANSFHKIFVMGVPPREAGRGNQVSNTSCMCISPVGILNPCDPRQAALDAYYLSQILHSDFPRMAQWRLPQLLLKPLTLKPPLTPL
ncbi:MAG: ADP-ribosylglycohydrolase family protein [Candidatus Bathyarchaeia archaeon]